MAQEKFDFFPFLPTELFQEVLLRLKFLDALSLLVASGPKFQIQGNGLEAFLPFIIRHLPIEAKAPNTAITYEETNSITSLLLKHSGTGLYLLCQHLYNNGSIGKFLFGNGKICSYLAMNQAEQALVSKAVCTGIIGLNEGLLDVFEEGDKDTITALIKKGVDQVIIEGMFAIAKATVNTNLLKAIEEQKLPKVKSLVHLGADLSRLDNWHYKPNASYSEIRETLEIIAYLNSKGSHIKVCFKNDFLPKASAEGDLDVLKLLCNQGVSQTAKNKALLNAADLEISSYLQLCGAVMPDIIEPLALHNLLLEHNPFAPLPLDDSMNPHQINEVDIIGVAA